MNSARSLSIFLMKVRLELAPKNSQRFAIEAGGPLDRPKFANELDPFGICQGEIISNYRPVGRRRDHARYVSSRDSQSNTRPLLLRGGIEAFEFCFSDELIQPRFGRFAILCFTDRERRLHSCVPLKI